VEAQPLSPASD